MGYFTYNVRRVALLFNYSRFKIILYDFLSKTKDAITVRVLWVEPQIIKDFKPRIAGIFVEHRINEIISFKILRNKILGVAAEL